MFNALISSTFIEGISFAWYIAIKRQVCRRPNIMIATRKNFPFMLGIFASQQSLSLEMLMLGPIFTLAQYNSPSKWIIYNIVVLLQGKVLVVSFSITWLIFAKSWYPIEGFASSFQLFNHLLHVLYLSTHMNIVYNSSWIEC